MASRCRFAADVGLGACDENGVDAHAAKRTLQRRRAGDQGAVAVLHRRAVGRRSDQLGPDALFGRSEAFERLVPNVVGDDGVEEQLPIALATGLLVGMQNPDHRHAEPPKLSGQSVDGRDDPSRRRHLGRAAGRTKRILHIDDDQRRAGRIEPIEQVIAAAAFQNAVGNLLANGDGMHG
jgi:hypothetical protein